MINKKAIKNSLLGFSIGDMVGVPVEFVDRGVLIKKPIKKHTKRKGYVHNVPFGTWSDDTSLTLATMNAIVKNKTFNKREIFKEIMQWYFYGKYTHDGNLPFDVGHSTSKAIIHRASALNYNYAHIENNGNGGMMRILPAIYYLYHDKEREMKIKELVELTHAHYLSIFASLTYANIIWSLMDGETEKITIICDGINKGKNFVLSNCSADENILNTYIDYDSIMNPDSEYLRSTGFVMDTLFSVLWGFYQAEDFDNGLLNVINLGGDTDTIGALTGALLGYYYYEIPINKMWLKKLAKKEYLNENFDNFLELLS